MAAIAAALTACAPTPEQSPTPTTFFATEDEAYDAAEKTYRAYRRALNAVDTRDPATFERVYMYVRGDFANRDRENLNTMNTNGYNMSGDLSITAFRGVSVNEPMDSISADVCFDLEGADILDEFGNSILRADRPQQKSMRVIFAVVAGELRIVRANKAEEDVCASP